MRLAPALLLVAACTSKPAPHASQTFQVEIRGMQFVPASLRVHRGDLVVFTNKDIVPHTATAPGWFDSGPLQPGDRWTYGVTEAIDYQYGCTMHPTMHGDLNALER
jgi:plastocyanin